MENQAGGMEHQDGFVRPAAAAEGTTVEYPERNLQPGDPDLTGAAPLEAKKGIVGKVKDMMGRHGRKNRRARNQDVADPAVKGGNFHKAKAKVSHKVGHDQDGSKHSPAGMFSMSSSSSSLSSSDEENMGTVGFAMDPTGPAVAGSALGRTEFSNAPEGPGADFRDLNLDLGDDSNRKKMDQHSKRAAQYAKISNPLSPNYGKTQAWSEDDARGEPNRRFDTDTSNSQDAHGEHQTNPHDGSHGDSLKQEGFVQKITKLVR